MTRFGKTLHMRFFQKIEFDVWLISPTIELTCIQVLDPITCFAVELQSFVCDRVTPPTIEKLRSKGVAMHACVVHGVSIYYTYTGSQLHVDCKWTWVEPFEMNVKIEQGLNFDLDIESRFFFDT